MTQHPVRSWLPAYLVLALIWGNSFVFIKVGLGSLTPAGVVFSRLFLGMVTMLVISAITRTSLPPRRYWRPLFIAAFLMTSGGWFMFAFAEQYVSSALAGIMNGATPLLTLVIILIAFPEEHPTPQRIIGLVIGFAVAKIPALHAWALHKWPFFEPKKMAPTPKRVKKARKK